MTYSTENCNPHTPTFGIFNFVWKYILLYYEEEGGIV